MLRSEAGLQTMIALLGSGKTREKAQKILSVGYPDIKDEITARLLKESAGVARWLE